MKSPSKKVWLIGGLDPSGGAGLLLDNRVIQSFELVGLTVVSCMTLQNHDRCIDIRPMSCEDLLQQFELLLASGPPDAIKVGMIAGAEQVKIIAQVLAKLPVPKIIDPVLATSSGYQVADQSWLAAFREFLLPQATLLTPNIMEAEALTGQRITDPKSLHHVAMELMSSGCQAVLIKGGHRESEQTDLICDDYFDTLGSISLHAPLLDERIRGTGCFLASAIAAGLAKGLQMRDAVVYSRAKLMQAIQDGMAVGSHLILNSNHSPKHLPLLTDHIVKDHNLEFTKVEPIEMRLYPIVNSTSWLKRLLPLGVKTIQVRIKDAKGAELEEKINEACKIAKRWSCRLFINDHWELAIKYQAYGVHLGQEDLESADLEKIQASGLRLGISTHNYEELARALTLHPSYVALGPIFETSCKSMQFGPQGIARIGDWVRMADCPVIAIGGLKTHHAQAVLQQGAAGIALISDITEASDPDGQTQTWLSLVER